MTKEDKELLLKDLCARLPYGVICQVTFDEDNIFTETLESVNMKYINKISTSGSSCGVECIKSYLRPMSSMTEEEKKKYKKVCDLDMEILENHPMNGEPFPALYNSQDWLNANHFDYRGLIKKNLALEAPEGMYK